METLALIEPSLDFEDEYRAFNEEFLAVPALAIYGRHQPDEDFAAYIDFLHRMARGVGLEEWMVPQHTFWLVRDGTRIVGHSKLRMRLTSALEDYGGHIGYAVRPSEWRKGYGTRMLALTLEKARAFGLERVMLTCDKENIGSARVMEKNGGVLASEGVSPRDGKPTLRYWIELAR